MADCLKYIDNFEKIKNVDSILLKGDINGNVPFITIIIPTYLRHQLLKEALDSALLQIDFQDYEVLVVDNNPERKDQTELLLSMYTDEKIFYYKNTQNLGMAGNWNRAFQLVRSKWAVLLHDDDLISPYFLSTTVRYLKDESLSIAILKPQNRVFYNNIAPVFSSSEKQKKQSIKRIYFYDFMLGCAVGAPTNVIFNKDVVLGLGGFNQNYYPAYDYVFSARCAKKYSIYSLSEILGGYRVDSNESLSDNTMTAYFKNRFSIAVEIMQELKIPRSIIRIILSVTYQKIEDTTNSHYRTTYKINPAEFDFMNIPVFLSKCLSKLYFYTFRLVRFIR